MAARSPEPAKRCDRPQSFSVSAAGLRRASISENTSMAAASRAPGVMAAASADPGHDLDDEDHPHDEQHDRGYSVERAAHRYLVAGDVRHSLEHAEQNEHPGQDHKQQIGLLGGEREDRQYVEQHRQFELI